MSKKGPKSAFPCSKCGACCRRASQLPGFPLPTDENGACVYLTAENECEIYPVRPDVCNIEAIYWQVWAGKWTKGQYWRENAKVCNKMMDEDGMDESLRIAIDEITEP